MLDKAAVTKEAQKYVAKGEIDKAIAELQKLLIDEQDANIYNVIGDLYLRKKEKENAIEAFKKAANILREDGFYLKAIALYKKILNIHPSDVSTLISLGELNAERGLIGNANENFLTAADIFIKEGATEKVLDVYKKMLKLSPSNVSLKMKVAELSIKIGLIEEAVKEYIGVATYHLNRGETDEAQEFYLKVIGLDPKNVATFLGLSKMAELQNNIGQAFEYLKSAISVAPTNSDALLNYSRLAIEMGDVNEGKQSLLRLIEMDSSNNEYKKLLGNIYLKEGLLEKAWEELLPCIDETIHLEKWDEAIELLINFRDFDPIAVKMRLITIYKNKGDKKLAVEELRELTELYESKELLREAIQSYKELLELTPSDKLVEEKIKELEKAFTPPVITPLDEKPVSPTISPEILLKEHLSEADFYVQQGLKDEAVKIYERLLSLFPDNEEIVHKLEILKKPTLKEKIKAKFKKDRVSYI